MEVKCKNDSCSNAIMDRIEGLFALTKVTGEKENLSFHPASGIVVVCFVCPQCGEIKTYSAKRLKEL